MNAPAPDAVDGECRISIPTLKVKGTFLFASLPFQPGQPPSQLIPEHKQSCWIFRENMMQALKGCIAGEQTPEHGCHQ
jgi:hypothetical protein